MTMKKTTSQLSGFFIKARLMGTHSGIALRLMRFDEPNTDRDDGPPCQEHEKNRNPISDVPGDEIVRHPKHSSFDQIARRLTGIRSRYSCRIASSRGTGASIMEAPCFTSCHSEKYSGNLRPRKPGTISAVLI